MNIRLWNHWEKAALCASMLSLSGSGLWCWRHAPERSSLLVAHPGVVLRGPAFVPMPVGVPQKMTPAAAWEPPPATDGVVRELFSPPEPLPDVVGGIPQGHGDAKTIGLELLETRAEPYRLQLAGYFGEPGHYTGTFTSPQLPGPLLAREGGDFPGLDITLMDFSVKKIPAADGPGFEIAAVAVLQDGRTNGVVTIDSRHRKLTGRPVAVLRPVGPGESARECRIGDTVRAGDAVFRVEFIRLDPPEVVVAGQSDAKTGQVRYTLRRLVVRHGAEYTAKDFSTGHAQGSPSTTVSP